MNSRLVIALLCLSALTQNSYGSNDSIQIRKKELQILNTRNKIDNLLKTKAHMVTKELNGSMSGSIEGTIDGTYEKSTTLKTALGYGLIGALGGAAISGIGSLPFLVELGASTLTAAKVGGAVGAGAGVLLPGKEVAGKLKGSINGSIQGSTWDNKYDNNSWTALILKPDQFDKTQFTSECGIALKAMHEKVKKSGKFLTVNETAQMLNEISNMQEQVLSLESDLISLSDVKEREIVTKNIEKYKEWLNKKINFVAIGSNIKTKHQELALVKVSATYKIRQGYQRHLLDDNNERHFKTREFYINLTSDNDVNKNEMMEIFAKTLAKDINTNIVKHNYTNDSKDLEENVFVELILTTTAKGFPQKTEFQEFANVIAQNPSKIIAQPILKHFNTSGFDYSTESKGKSKYSDLFSVSNNNQDLCHSKDKDLSKLMYSAKSLEYFFANVTENNKADLDNIFN